MEEKLLNFLFEIFKFIIMSGGLTIVCVFIQFFGRIAAKEFFHKDNDTEEDIERKGLWIGTYMFAIWIMILFVY